MKKIRIADTTLKENMRQGDAYSFREKLEIAKLLDKVQVSVIELPVMGSGQADPLLVKSIAASVQNSCVAISAEHSVEGVERAWEAVKNAKNPRIQICVPMSPVQMEYVCHKKPPVMLEMIGTLCAKAKELCSQVEFIADDATRSEKDFLMQALEQAVKNGATMVTVCDAAGNMMPDEFQAFVEEIMKAPFIGGVEIGVACADSLFVAASSAVAAVRAGAAEVKSSVYGETVPAISSVSQIIRARGDEFGVSCDISFTQLQRTLKQIRVMTDARRKTSPFENGAGQPEVEALKIALTVNDSMTAVSNAVKSLGYDLSEDDMAKVYDAFLRIAEKKDVNVKELEAIVASAALQVPPTYSLESYVINTGNVISSTAHIQLSKEEKVYQGICVGDGPIDASFLAIEQIVGHHYELDDFQIQSVTEGREAMGSAFIKLRSNGKVYSGKGISTDILGASIRAYINALNKIVYEEN